MMSEMSVYSRIQSLQTLGGGRLVSEASASGRMRPASIAQAQVAACRCAQIQTCDMVRFTAASRHGLETHRPCQLPRVAVELLRATAPDSSSVLELRFSLFKGSVGDRWSRLRVLDKALWENDARFDNLWNMDSDVDVGPVAERTDSLRKSRVEGDMVKQ